MDTKKSEDPVMVVMSIIIALFTTKKLHGNLSEILKKILDFKKSWESLRNNGIHPAITYILELNDINDEYYLLQSFIDSISNSDIKAISSNIENESNTSQEANCIEDLKETRMIASSWLENNICQSICDPKTAEILLQAHLLEEEKLCEPTEVPALHRTILTFYRAQEYETLALVIKEVVKTLHSKKTDDYNQTIRTLLYMLEELVSQNHFEDIGEKAEVYTSLFGYLAKNEELWKAQRKNYLPFWELPPVHRSILKQFEEVDEEKTIEYIRSVILESLQSDSLDYIHSKLQIAFKGNHGIESLISDKLFEYGDKLIASIGSTLSAGLSALHVLVPASAAFKPVIQQVNSLLLSPSLSST